MVWWWVLLPTPSSSLGLPGKFQAVLGQAINGGGVYVPPFYCWSFLRSACVRCVPCDVPPQLANKLVMQELLRRAAAPACYFLFCFPLRWAGGALARPPCTPTLLGLCPKAPFRLRSALGLFVSYLATLGAQTNRIARKAHRFGHERGALIGCLLQLISVPQRVIATL